MAIYYLWVSSKYGYQQGLAVTVLTWSFFVFCTPVADAGFLIDFPLRLILKLRMVFLESLVWVVAAALNFYFFFFYPEVYTKTKLLDFFYYILANPFPFWIIIIISAIGTFVSIQFGDELMDKVQHKERVMHQKHKLKYRLLISVGLFVLTFIAYNFALKQMGISAEYFKNML